MGFELTFPGGSIAQNHGWSMRAGVGRCFCTHHAGGGHYRKRQIRRPKTEIDPDPR
jgi:hypothetical protein